MKFKFVHLTLCMMTLFASNVYADNLKKAPINKKGSLQLMSKDANSLPFYNATDTGPITLTGAGNAAFSPLSFTDFVHDETGSVKANKLGNQFRLDKGTYLILFTGTFEAHEIVETSLFGIFYDIALQVGSQVEFINTDSRAPAESGVRPIRISSLSKVIKLDKKTNVAIIARDKVPNSFVNVTTRSLTIIKLS